MNRFLKEFHTVPVEVVFLLRFMLCSSYVFGEDEPIKTRMFFHMGCSSTRENGSNAQMLVNFQSFFFTFFQPQNYGVCDRVFNKVTGHLLKLPEDIPSATERKDGIQTVLC